MKSRTADGKHTKRFIVLLKNFDGSYTRSGNDVIKGFFATKEEALQAVKVYGGEGLPYKVRQK